MKLKTALIAAVSFVLGGLVAIVYPAIAQSPGSQSAWEVSFTRPTATNGNVTIVKHNRITGQTLVLSCPANACGKELKWSEFPEESIGAQ